MGFRKASAWIGAAALLAAVGGSTLTASAIPPVTSCVVTSNGDQHSANSLVSPCNSTSGQVTLRSAIELFNLQHGHLSITFSPSLPTPTSILLSNGELDVTDSITTDGITITGAGIDSTIVNANHLSAIIHTAGAALSINSITLENGQTALGASGIVALPVDLQGGASCNAGAADVSISAVRLTGNVVSGGVVAAGAIAANHASIRDSFITGNSATGGGQGNAYEGLVNTCNHVDLINSTVSNNTGAASPLQGYNDGIFSGNSGATVTNSRVTSNTMSAATNGVDGIFDTGGEVDITDSSLTSNTLSSPGGGADGLLDVNVVHLIRSSLDDNHLLEGSGKFDCGMFCISGGQIDSSSISGNTSTSGDGAGFRGRGLCSQFFCTSAGPLPITNSTFAGNVLTTGADTKLLGQYVDGDGSIQSGTTVTVLNSTFARNQVNLGLRSTFFGGPFIVQSLTVQNSIFGENAGKNCNSAIALSVVVTVTHTLDTDGSCGFPSGNGNLNNQNAQFVGNVQVNPPGSTRTLAIGASSPARDSADNSLCPTLDQRGVIRLAGDPVCDMGAYEFVQAAVVTPTPTAVPTPGLPRAGRRSDGGLPATWVLLFGLVGAALGFRGLLARRDP